MEHITIKHDEHLEKLTKKWLLGKDYDLAINLAMIVIKGYGLVDDDQDNRGMTVRDYTEIYKDDLVEEIKDFEIRCDKELQELFLNLTLWGIEDECIECGSAMEEDVIERETKCTHCGHTILHKDNYDYNNDY